MVDKLDIVCYIMLNLTERHTMQKQPVVYSVFYNETAFAEVTQYPYPFPTLASAKQFIKQDCSANMPCYIQKHLNYEAPVNKYKAG